MQTYIRNARLLLPNGSIRSASVLFDQSICSISPDGLNLQAGAIEVDAGGALLTPGLIDIHTHGIGAYAFEKSPEDLIAGLNLLPSFGVTTVLPTLYRSLSADSLNLLRELAASLGSVVNVRVPGFHFEGPFLAIAGAGALTMRADRQLLEDLVSACSGRVSAMSISPEVPGIIGIIERLVELHIAPFITHTRATAEETQNAIDAGARHATHFYDVFPLPFETEAGVRPVGAVEALLADRRASVDFICDGVHVHPAAIRAALAAKGKEGVIAITDSNIGAGCGEGTFDTPWGYRIRIKQDDAARVADEDHPLFGKIAGSSLTLNRAVANLRQWMPDDESTPWHVATRNPARLLKLTDRGELRVGASADLVLWDSAFNPTAVWVAGRRIEFNGEQKVHHV